MGTFDDFTEYNQELITRHGKRSLDKYGVKACEASSAIDDLDIKQSSLHIYKVHIRKVISELSTKTPDPTDVIEYIDSNIESPSTQSVAITSLRKYYIAIDDQEGADELRRLVGESNVGRGVENIGVNIKEWLTEEEANRILADLMPDADETMSIIDDGESAWSFSIEHKALVATLYYTGCKVSEICKRDSDDFALSIEDINSEDNTINVRVLDSGEDEFIRERRLVPTQLINILNKYIQFTTRDSGPIFDFTTRTAESRIKEINGAYKYFFGGLSNANTITPRLFMDSRIKHLSDHHSVEYAVMYASYDTSGTLSIDDQVELLPDL